MQSRGERPAEPDSTETELLARIAQGLHTGRVSTTPGSPALPTSAARRSASWDPTDSLPASPPNLPFEVLAERFLTELTRLNGHGLRAGSRAEGTEYACTLATRLAKSAPAPCPVLLWDDPLLSSLRLAQALSARGLEVVVWDPAVGRGAAKSLAASACLGITSAAWGVAETGTLALPTSPGRGRLVSLLPPVHLAFLTEDRLLPSLAELFRTVAARAREEASFLPSSLALATGPSRSADIENDLSIGVHGPAEVHVVLLAELR